MVAMGVSVWCFQCGAAYDEDVLECGECGVATFPHQPQPPEDVGGPDDEQIAYELHEWSYSSRNRLEASLVEREVEHSWLGPTLIVCERDEEVVDQAVDEVQLAELPSLDETQPTMEYELDEFNDVQRAEVIAELVGEGIAHKVTAGGVLLVQESDEEAVDQVFDRLANATNQRAFGPGLTGVEPYKVLETLFFSTDRLRRYTADTKAIQDFATSYDLVVQLSLPWGYDAEFWRAMLAGADNLHNALTAGPDPVDGDTAISEAATLLRNLLRPYM